MNVEENSTGYYQKKYKRGTQGTTFYDIMISSKKKTDKRFEVAAGSSLLSFLFGYLVQRLERLSHKQQVVGSIPTVSI